MEGNQVRAAQNAALEGEAVALVRQYGFFLPQAARDFLRRIAVFLEWQKLQGVLK